MELREYVGLIRKWLWLILLCTLANATGELQKTGANVLGVALNRLDPRRGYNYHYYYYYSDEETGERRRPASRGSHGSRFRLPWQNKPAA